ncbi:MAG: sugar ABC transporter substrate-binding protein [Chloroflexi bacterium HGW-Chloroflexi-1]|nr:MAG: sugar ABC transporter substrate-binding protein [Chloroflexi bacterium HGW-Chloroflexi-1]
MKRTALFNVLAALAVLSFLAACVAPAATPAAPVVVKETVIATAAPRVQVVYNSYQSDPEPRKAEKELIKMFQARYPNVDVVYSVVAHEDFKQAIRAYLTSSTPPDVMTWFAGNRARFFIDKGTIMDVSDVWKQEGWDKSFPKGFLALSTVDGKQYSVPNNYYWWAVYYNKTVFAQYNLQPPETWDEFLAVCDTLKKNGVTPIAIGTKGPWTAAGWFDYLNMRTNGPEFHINLMLGKEKYDDPRVKKTFENWKVLLDKGYFLDNAASYEWQEAVAPLVQGKAGMYLMGQFIMDSIPKEQQKDFDFFRFPIIDPKLPIGEDAPTDIYWVSANAPHPEQARQLLAFLGSKEAQEYWAKTLKRLPVNSEVDQSILTAESKKGIELIKGADYVAQFYDRDTTPEMAEKGMAAMQQFWTNTDKIDSILAQLEKDRAQIFAEQK